MNIILQESYWILSALHTNIYVLCVQFVVINLKYQIIGS